MAVDAPGEPAPVGRGTAPHLRAVARSVGAKAVTMPVAAIVMLLGTRTVVDSLGVSGYALYALVTTLTAMLPLGDLGVGAAVVEAAVAGREGDREPLRRAVLSGARVLLLVGSLAAAVGVLPASFGLWGPMLGKAAQPGVDAAVCVAFALMGCSLPLQLGRSVLIAVNRAPLALLLQAGGGALGLVLLLGAAALRAAPVVFVASGFLAQCVMGVVALLLAGRITGLPLLGLVLGCARAGQPTVRIRHLAGPMAVINASTVVSYATDRLVLSHVTGPAAVAVYSAGAQLFTPAAGLVGVAGLPLWALFARQRRPADRPSRADLARLTRWFTTGGLLLGLALILLGPAVSSWMMHGRGRAGVVLMAAFAALVLVQAAYYPAGMWLTDAAGLRFQATRAAVMAVVNLAASIPLARLLGPAGPVIASVAAFSCVVFVPSFRRALSRA
jgi:O-antigen/teichoic acid export membrane protein